MFVLATLLNALRVRWNAVCAIAGQFWRGTYTCYEHRCRDYVCWDCVRTTCVYEED